MNRGFEMRKIRKFSEPASDSDPVFTSVLGKEGRKKGNGNFNDLYKFEFISDNLQPNTAPFIGGFPFIRKNYYNTI